MEKEWWESRKDWRERFPFKPTHHSEITFDPTVYDPRKTGEQPDEGKDGDYWEMKRRVESYSFLRDFHESIISYTEEFEQMEDIIKEESSAVNNTLVLGETFSTLADYHYAAQQEPDGIQRENSRVYPLVLETNETSDTTIILGDDFSSLSKESQQVYLASLLKSRKEVMEAWINPPYERCDVTRAEEAELLKEYILGAMVSPEVIPQEWQLGIAEEQAIAI